MIAIVDYGMGNLRSVTNAFRKLGGDVTITRDMETIKNSRAIVLPGVGAFGKCIENLKKLDLFDVLKELIMNDKRYLGICLGMQVLFESSEEAPGTEGMGIIKGDVPRFKGNTKVPHMGWNSVEIQRENPIFNGINDGEFFYFVHSYFCRPTEDVTATKTHYGAEFASSVQKGNLFACQFHPEKSQRVGLQLLQNFIEMQK
ncbi:MAG: imidazole glycerol phosphate synthase subunit HisH [Proteobacteria bacterium]|nr:imidazole glycerol phosphate synthase subunit HisH [Pseudomonadota bacterium]